MKTDIQIRVENSVGMIVVRTMPATVHNGWALHHHYDSRGTKNKHRWTVTHVATGLALIQGQVRERALALWEACKDIPEAMVPLSVYPNQQRCLNLAWSNYFRAILSGEKPPKPAMSKMFKE